jgi:hypothetical protein
LSAYCFDTVFFLLARKEVTENMSPKGELLSFPLDARKFAKEPSLPFFGNQGLIFPILPASRSDAEKPPRFLLAFA